MSRTFTLEKFTVLKFIIDTSLTPWQVKSASLATPAHFPNFNLSMHKANYSKQRRKPITHPFACPYATPFSPTRMTD